MRSIGNHTGQNLMDINAARSMSAVRDGWSEEERRARKDRAEAMQLQLKALVVLTGLGDDRAEQEEKPAVAMASAC